eukprot:TRINITY_DN2598_c0_g2_i1.p1 TRINITY_DN2598_c0_g2~~TRINITY_DN2598_c0_g2_i1.p1  ORF type:complete len:373 (-),score=68.58 TRINITY_DN2598_c0_g2_i1:53-1171(-)
MRTRCMYGIAAVLLALQAQLGVAGSNICECEDIVPKTQKISCLEQKLYGKCFVDWMLAGGYCAQTCGRCKCDSEENGLESPAVEKEVDILMFKSSEDDEVVVKKSVRNEDEDGVCDPDCTDVAPNDAFTCAQQASFGKCLSVWMVEANFCAASCERCIPCDDEAAKDVPVIKAECDDIAPTDELTCKDQKRFKKCSREWMIEGGFCRKSCGRCNTKEKTSKPKEQDPITIFEDLLAKALQPKNSEKEVEKEEEEKEVEVEPIRVVQVSVTPVLVPQEEEKEETKPVLIEEDKKEKVRQDMQALLAQNSDMEYMEALGFELSRSVMDAIRDDFESEEVAIEQTPLSTQSASEAQTFIPPAPEVETLDSVSTFK